MSDQSISIPSTQKAQVLKEYGLNPVLEEVPVPEPKNDEILIHLLYSGVCHSDVSIMKQTLPWPSKLPLIAGHEGAGIVVKMGPNVRGFKIGDRVGCTVLNRLCNTCEFCRRKGNESFCNAPEFLTAGGINGTFQQYITVAAYDAYLIPEGVDLAKAAPAHCAGWTVYRAMKETHAQPGQFVAITGAGGGVGSFGVQFAKALGFRPIAIDFGDTKREHCLKLGAEFFIDAKNTNVVEEVLKDTDGFGPHAVVNIAPSTKPIEDAIKYIRKCGTIVCVALPDDPKFAGDVMTMIFKGITIKGTLLGSRSDLDEVLQFLKRGLIDIPIEIVGLSELPDAIKRLDQYQVNGRLVLDTSK